MDQNLLLQEEGDNEMDENQIGELQGGILQGDGVNIHHFLEQLQHTFEYELESAYIGGYQLETDLEIFFYKWNGLLSIVPLTTKEKLLLDITCTFTYEKDQSGLSDEQAEECSICYERYGPGQSLLDVPGCSHKFHQICLHAWLSKNMLCPLCKCKIRHELIKKVNQLSKTAPLSSEVIRRIEEETGINPFPFDNDSSDNLNPMGRLEDA